MDSAFAESDENSSNAEEEDVKPDIKMLALRRRRAFVPEDPKCFDKRSVLMIGSRLGIDSLSEEVCETLANQVFYKIGQIIHMSRVIMHQNKRDSLTTNDVQKALNLFGGIQLYGHNNNDDPSFMYGEDDQCTIKKGILVECDGEHNLFKESLSQDAYYHYGDPYIQGAWIIPNDNDLHRNEISSYFSTISKILLLGNISHKRIALLDLRTNPKINQDCVYFLNLVAYTVKKMPRNLETMTTMVDTISAIAENRFIDPSPYMAANRAGNSLLKIVIERTNNNNNCEDLPLKLKAGLLLAKVLILWSIEYKQKVETEGLLRDRLLDKSSSFQTVFGSFVTLLAFGHWKAIEVFISRLEELYKSKLNSNWQEAEQYSITNESDQYVLPQKYYMNCFQYIMISFLVSINNRLKKLLSTDMDILNFIEFDKLIKMDRKLYEIFGDSVIPFQLLRQPYFASPSSPPKRRRSKLFIARNAPEGFNFKNDKLEIDKIFHIKRRLNINQSFTAPMFWHQNLNNQSIHLNIKRPAAMYYQPNTQKRPLFSFLKKIKKVDVVENSCFGTISVNL